MCVYNALLHFFIFHPPEFLTPCMENIGVLKLLKVALCTLSVSVRCWAGRVQLVCSCCWLKMMKIENSLLWMWFWFVFLTPLPHSEARLRKRASPGCSAVSERLSLIGRAEHHQLINSIKWTRQNRNTKTVGSIRWYHSDTTRWENHTRRRRPVTRARQAHREREYSQVYNTDQSECLWTFSLCIDKQIKNVYWKKERRDDGTEREEGRWRQICSLIKN